MEKQRTYWKGNVLGQFDPVDGGGTFEEKHHSQLHVMHKLPEHKELRPLYNFLV